MPDACHASTFVDVSHEPILRASGALGLVEAAHDGNGDWQAWCERLLDASQRFLRGQAINLGILQRHPTRYAALGSASSQPGLDSIIRAQVERSDPTDLDPFARYAPYVGTISGVLGEAAPQGELAEFMAMIGHVDVLGLVGVVDEYSVSIGGPYPVKKLSLTARDRRLLVQVTLHLEAGLRLRLRRSHEIGVLRPDGRVVHAEGRLRDARRVRTQLRDHVTAVEQARRQRARAAASAADAWSALVNGDWGIVERVDADGKRHYVVLETQCAPRLKALTPLETQVVELSARGLTGKAVAYALGVPGPLVSQTLFSATLKLGLRSRTEVVALAARLLGTPREAEQLTTLTAAERDVLGMVRMGLTNAAIASARQRSERTVANQVASLLKKLDAPSRRSLAATG
jgi:DNA-binding NarL/FixJ family response regulator